MFLLGAMLTLDSGIRCDVRSYTYHSHSLVERVFVCCTCVVRANSNLSSWVPVRCSMYTDIAEWSLKLYFKNHGQLYRHITTVNAIHQNQNNSSLPARSWSFCHDCSRVRSWPGSPIGPPHASLSAALCLVRQHQISSGPSFDPDRVNPGLSLDPVLVSNWFKSTPIKLLFGTQGSIPVGFLQQAPYNANCHIPWHILEWTQDGASIF